MNIKYQVGKDDELKCSKEEQENNKENEVLEEEKEKNNQEIQEQENQIKKLKEEKLALRNWLFKFASTLRYFL